MGQGVSVGLGVMVGVGVASTTGLALTLKDMYHEQAPQVHIIEGEGGMTPGRVAEAMAAAASSGLDNLYFHVDWNQASIDSNAVTRDGDQRGEYVQWDPAELFLGLGEGAVHRFGFSLKQIADWKSIVIPSVKRPRSLHGMMFRHPNI